jgi:hypothetical protein
MVYRKDWGQPQQGAQGFARTMKAFGRKVNLSVVDLGTTNNVIGCFVVPGGFQIVGMIGPAVPVLGPALSLSIGDAGQANRYLSGSNIGVAGGAMPAMASTGFFRTFSDTEIQMLIATQSSAPVAGIFEFYLYGMVV